LPAETSPLDVTLDQAVHLLAQPKAVGRGRGAVKREPLKVFDASPVTGQKVQLLDGRYGPYVTDGQTNASLPKGTAVDELTFQEAIDLLAARAAAGPPQRKIAKRRTAPKSNAAAKKSTAKRRPAKAAAQSPKSKGRQATKRA
jgi:DNA topoisomerase-1